MKLTNSKGKKQDVRRGLVDSSGCFLLLLDDNDCQYYRFSDESELVSQLIDQADKLRKSNAQMKKSIDKLKKDNDALLEDIKTQCEHIAALTVEVSSLRGSDDGEG